MHTIEYAVPVAVRLATVGLFIAQNCCEAEPVGVEGLGMTDTVTD